MRNLVMEIVLFAVAAAICFLYGHKTAGCAVTGVGLFLVVLEAKVAWKHNREVRVYEKHVKSKYDPNSGRKKPEEN